MNNDLFDKQFQKLSSLFDSADEVIQEYNSLLSNLQKNPPKNPENSSSWREVKDLKPLFIN